MRCGGFKHTTQIIDASISEKTHTAVTGLVFVTDDFSQVTSGSIVGPYSRDQHERLLHELSEPCQSLDA